MERFIQEFVSENISRIEMNTPKIKKCLENLTEDQLWARPNEASNSLGNIILHLCGNIGQYILSALGNVPDTRERDKEFSTDSGYSKMDLLEKLRITVEKAVKVIRSCNENSLLRSYNVQGFELSGIGIILHVTEHYSYHTGQVIFWTKLLTRKDLEFYKGIDLNQKNVL